MRAPETIGGAFTTRYSGPTAGGRGGRIVVRGPNGERAAVPYDHGIRQGEEQHRAAVLSCIHRWGPRLVSAEPPRYLVGGELPARGGTSNGFAWFVVEP